MAPPGHDNDQLDEENGDFHHPGGSSFSSPPESAKNVFGEPEVTPVDVTIDEAEDPEYCEDIADEDAAPHSSSFSDIPIESGDHGSSLPAPEEARMNSPRARGGVSIFPLILLATLVILALVLGLSLGLTKNQRHGSPSVESTSGVTRNSNINQVIEFLTTTGISSSASLSNTASNQYHAAEWLAEVDQLNLPIPSPMTLGTAEGYRYGARYILTLLWFALGGNTWDVQIGFLLEIDACLWNSLVPYQTAAGTTQLFRTGVYCDNNGFPFSLVLESNNLKGTLPTEISMLTSLEYIDFGGNYIKGEFYPELCNLDQLRFLGISNNGFAGSLPTCLSRMTDLAYLLLSNNQFSGQLPDLTNLTNMNSLYLDSNRFLGNITSAFNTMHSLVELIVEDNLFTANLDGNFLNQSSLLQILDVSGMSLRGQFPGHLLSTGNLTIFDFHDNQLAGTIPSDISDNSHLRFLAFQQNKFTGDLPATLANLRALEHLDASSNSFDGTISTEIGMMSHLTYLFLADNNFQPGPIPSSFSQMTKLQELSLKSTARTGAIPSFLGKLTNLVFLDLGNNEFNGSIPADLGNLTKLEFLLLNQNQYINGDIPPSFSKLKGLKAAFFDMTSLTRGFTVMCALPNFNHTPNRNVHFGNELLSANCAGSYPQVTCHCCELCCSSDQMNCNQNTLVASLDPLWEYSFDRAEYTFNKHNASVMFDYVPYSG